MELRIRLYPILVTSRLLNSGESLAFNKAELWRLESAQTSHFCQIEFAAYTAHVPNAPIRHYWEVSIMESRFQEARLCV